MTRDSIAVVYNPRSGSGKARAYVDEIIAIANSNFEFNLISGPDAITTQKRLSDEIYKSTAVFAIGGDGLVNLTLQELANRDLPLYVFPAGTGNDFHRHNYRKISSLRALTEGFSRAAIREIDLALVRFQNSSRFYGQVLSAGFDSLCNARANRLRYLPGSLKYVLALILELPSFRPLKYSVKIDGVDREFEAMMVVVANGPTYGGGMRVLPDAVSNDGLFDVMILHPVSKLELLRVFPKVFSGKHKHHQKVEILRCQKISISVDAPIYADGEYFGKGPFTIEMKPSTLKVLDIN